MSAPDASAADGKPRSFALGGQGVKPRFGGDSPAAAGRRGFSLTGALAAAPAPSDEPADDDEPLPEQTADQADAASAPAPVPAPVPDKVGEPVKTRRAARPVKAATRAPAQMGTKILNTSIPSHLFAEIDDASSAWFAANGELARRSRARKSLNTFTVAVLTLGLQAVKDSNPEDVAALFPPIKR